MNPKTRGYALLVVLITALIGGLFLSVAFARPKRVSPRSNVTSLAPIYVNGNFTFTTPQELIRPLNQVEGDLDQSQEPEIKIDIFGNIYVTGIHGVPGGLDFWKSTDKGANFVYLGQPDGAQDHCSAAG